MSSKSMQKRSQFSSCDACRQSRVACDATKRERRTDISDPLDPCSRCSRRDRPCTFQWIDDAKKYSFASKARVDPFIAYEPPSAIALRSDHGISIDNLPSADYSHPEEILTQWYERIFSRGLEAVLGLLLGKYGCPFVKSDLICDPKLSASLLFEKLDARGDKGLSAQSQSDDPSTMRYQQQKEDRVETAMRNAIRAFVAPWLALTPQANYLPSAKVEHIARETWRSARREMLKVINRASYRSVLTLYLYAQTPLPVGITEDEKLDGLSSHVCMQTALSQLQELRARIATVPLECMDLETKVHWVAMIWDTSTSLLSHSRTSLTSGLKGACSEPTWRLVKAYLVGSFIPKTIHWHRAEYQLNNKDIEEIIAAAFISTTYIWKNMTSVKEALREGVRDDEVNFTWSALRDAFDVFLTSIRPLLDRCETRFPLVDPCLQLNLYQVRLQYCLGVLILLDALENAARLDLLGDLHTISQDVLDASFDVLRIGLETRYSIDASMNVHRSFNGSPSNITTTLIAIDPYPQYVVDMVLKLHKRVHREYNWCENTQHDRSKWLSTLCASLQQLPQSAKSVQEALVIVTPSKTS